MGPPRQGRVQEQRSQWDQAAGGCADPSGTGQAEEQRGTGEQGLWRLGFKSASLAIERHSLK